MKTPRKLRVIDINDDQNTELRKQQKMCVDYTRISQVEDVAYRLAAGGLSADIYLADVNMCENHPMDDEPPDLWPRRSGRPMCLYGPILALPFLSAPPPAVFEPYSNFFTDRAVTKNGVVLIALSLILSRTTGRAHSLTDVIDVIRKYEGSVNAAHPVLKRALSRFRSSLCEAHKAGDIHIVQIPRTIHRLDARKAAVAANPGEWLKVPEDHVDRFFVDENGPISISFFRDDDATRDDVRVDSLFADVLGLGDGFGEALEEADASALSERFSSFVVAIVKELDEWPYEDTAEGKASLHRLEALAPTFDTTICLCKARDSKDFGDGAVLRKAHALKSCCWRSDVVAEEESARLRYLLQAPAPGPRDRARIEVFRRLCDGTGVFNCIKYAAQKGKTTYEEPTVAMVATLLWMMLPNHERSIEVADEVSGGLGARLVKVPGDWCTSLWGIAQLAEKEKSKKTLPDSRPVRLATSAVGLTFFVPNGLSGDYGCIRSKGAKGEPSDTAGYFKAVYMKDAADCLPSDECMNGVCVREKAGRGLVVTWCGVEIKRGGLRGRAHSAGQATG